MSTHPPDRSIDRSQISKPPYSPSLASVSSSASSIFSLATSVSSVASSIASLTKVHSSESIQDIGDNEHHAWSQETHGKETVRQSHASRTLRQTQRRAQRCAETHKPTCTTEACPMPLVPTLVRQAERKTNFVDNLVDSAAQIVETIWPTYMNGKVESSAGKGVLPLRTFIQETLRRSRTSYSTLQVALYYLIVVRPHIPKGDFSDMSQEIAQQMRALQCGRRMFLAALILASKYLQDRNYSARAWSRISGLQTTEININEMAFLHAVNWRLHISETIFQKWTDLVVKYTSGSGGSGSPGDEARKVEWSKLIVKLTPDLAIEEEPLGNVVVEDQEPEVVGKVVVPAIECSQRADTENGSYDPTPSQAPMLYLGAASSSTASIPKVTVSSLLSSPKNQSLPLPTLEPQPQNTTLKSYPQSTRLVGLSTISSLKNPAVRLGSGNAMSSAAAAAQLNQLQRCTTEDMTFLSRKCNAGRTNGERGLPLSSAIRSTMLTRRSSLSCSMTSSPETLNDSDSSTTSSPFASFSRSSSISSASSFESIGSCDTGRRSNKTLSIIPQTMAPTECNSTKGTGLNTPTPSPPKYLPLRPRASKEFGPEIHNGTSRIAPSHCRKRRIGELGLSLPIPAIDNGVSPNLSSGMTPQMKVQMQMRTPPLTNGLGPKRIRCGTMEPSVLALPGRRGSREEVS